MNAYIVDGIRTPIGNFGGTLAPVRADDLAAMALAELVRRNPLLDPQVISDVFLGCANQAGEDNRNVARMSLLLAGLPYTVPGETVNRLCSSGLSAIIHANRAIKAGDGHVFIAGGIENMTRGPLVVSKPTVAFGTDSKMYDSSFGWRFINPKLHAMYGTDAMGDTAENLAEKYNISREDQDAFAVESYSKSAEAWKNGKFSNEVVPVSVPQRKGDPILISEDEEYKNIK
jgi:acetyl-CoA acetyltransferase family protein